MLGKMFISAVLAEGSVASLLQYGEIGNLFKANEVEVYGFVREFVKQYQALPSPETILAHVDEALVPHKEPSAYYYDLLTQRHVELELKKAMKKATELLMPAHKNPEAALVTITEAVMELVAQKHTKQVVDFRDAYETLVQDYVSKWNSSEEYGLHLGWPTLDKMSGGFVRGDLISYVGRPAAGKTFQMLHGALHGWRKGKVKDPNQNNSRLFVSMEMGTLPIRQRLAAMFAHLPAHQIKHASLTSKNLAKFKDSLIEIQGFQEPFWIVDGNLTATVEDMWMLARQLKPGAIFIDGGYLAKHPTIRDRYQRVAENADLMKSELTPIAPTVVSWQFAKTAAKKSAKKGEKVGLEDIGYTDAIAQVSSSVLGLFEDESVETLKQRLVEIMKGRNGEVGSFRTNWNFMTMDFSEIEEPDVDDLLFL